VRHRAGLVVAAGVCGAVAVAAPASAGVVRSVTIDCVGDAVVGRVRLQGAADGVTRITLLGRTGEGRFAALARTSARTKRGDTEVAYTFALRRHLGAYRVRAVAGDRARASQVVHDRTCQPPAEVPEAGAAAAVPLAMGAAGGAAWYLRRRRAGGPR
jgi:hypothetical protein